MPPGGTLSTTLPGQGFLVRAAHAFAVVPRFVEPCGAFAAGFLNDDLFLG